MYKLPKIVLVFDPDSNNEKNYHGCLDSSGFVVHQSFSEDIFLKDCDRVIPDIIVLNSTHEDLRTEAICKVLRKHIVMKKVPIISLVKKIGFASTNRAKKNNIELEDFPLKNHSFLLMIKKLSKKMIMPTIHLDSNNSVSSEIQVDLEDISEVHLSFLAPIKMSKNTHIEIKAKILDTIGIVDRKFESCSKAVMHESKQYRNEVCFRGISVDSLRELKKYLAGNREK